MPAIEVEGLRKSYGSVQAVDELSFQVQTGELVAVLGHNGAGKTTTVEILEGHLPRDEGRVSVLGFDPQTGGRLFRERIGIVLQEAGINPTITVEEAFRLYESFWMRPRPAHELLEVVGLADKRSARVATLSGGQRRRLDLALGLVGRPDVLFLDEPTTGFDPVARKDAWQLIGDLRSSGTAVLLTTHYMEEAERLADRALVMAHGRLLASGTPTELSEQLGTRAVITFRLPGEMDVRNLPAPLTEQNIVGDRVELRTSAPTGALYQLTSWAAVQGVELEGLRVSQPTLEDVYLELAVPVEVGNG